jgi:hypothetical protein
MFDAQIGGNLKSNARTELSDRKWPNTKGS